MSKTVQSGRAPAARSKPRPNKRWRADFLEKLAETSNITAAAKWARTTTGQVYAARRSEPEFARKWQAALCEGYDNLEMELLYRLRTGQTVSNAGAKFDFAVAARLLAAHRESANRERALRDNEDADKILDEIDAKLDSMRDRARAAAEAKVRDENPQ